MVNQQPPNGACAALRDLMDILGRDGLKGPRKCTRVPEVCGSMRKYAEVCGSMRKYAEVCGSMRKYAEVCGSMRKYISSKARQSQTACSTLPWELILMRRCCKLGIVTAARGNLGQHAWYGLKVLSRPFFDICGHSWRRCESHMFLTVSLTRHVQLMQARTLDSSPRS